MRNNIKVWDPPLLTYHFKAILTQYFSREEASEDVFEFTRPAFLVTEVAMQSDIKATG